MKQYLAIDIGGTAVKLGIVDEEGRVLSKTEQSVCFDGYQTPILTTVLKAAQEAGDTDKVKKYSSLLYAQAQLIEGLPVDDPAAYAEAVCSLMK